MTGRLIAVKPAFRLGLLGLMACSGPAPARPPVGATRAAPAAAPTSATAAAPAPGANEKFEWAFWTTDGKLVAASGHMLVRLDPASDRASTCGASAVARVDVSTLHARNGADRFVVEADDGRLTLWDASALKPVGPVEHAARHGASAISKDGSRVAFGGCAAFTDASSVTTCGELYDGKTGRHVAGFASLKGFEELEFSDDGRYLLARGSSVGLTVFDAATGRHLVERPAWQRTLDVHAWNRPDLAHVTGDRLVVGHGSSVELIELTSGKTLGRTTHAGKTLAVLAPKTMRVVVLEGKRGRVHVWDTVKNRVVRTFELRIQRGANCTHCALEVDELDEDRVWLTSAYTNDRWLLHIGSGVMERVEHHALRSESVPSSTHRLEERYDGTARETSCWLARRDRDDPPRRVPRGLCNRSGGPLLRGATPWPYPGFDPGGQRLASVYEHQLHVFDVDRLVATCTLGEGDDARR